MTAIPRQSRMTQKWRYRDKGERYTLRQNVKHRRLSITWIDELERYEKKLFQRIEEIRSSLTARRLFDLPRKWSSRWKHRKLGKVIEKNTNWECGRFGEPLQLFYFFECKNHQVLLLLRWNDTFAFKYEKEKEWEKE